MHCRSLSFWQGHSPREQRYRRTKCHWREDRSRSSKHQLNFLSLSLYLSLQKCSTQLPEKRQCDQMDSNGTKEQAYPPSCPTPLIPWPPLAGEVDEGIGQASMLAGRPTHLFDNPVSGTIVLAFDARCVKYHRIIYNYIYIYTIHTYSTILYYSISK